MSQRGGELESDFYSSPTAGDAIQSFPASAFKETTPTHYQYLGFGDNNSATPVADEQFNLWRVDAGNGITSWTRSQFRYDLQSELETLVDASQGLGQSPPTYIGEDGFVGIRQALPGDGGDCWQYFVVGSESQSGVAFIRGDGTTVFAVLQDSNASQLYHPYYSTENLIDIPGAEPWSQWNMGLSNDSAWSSSKLMKKSTKQVSGGWYGNTAFTGQPGYQNEINILTVSMLLAVDGSAEHNSLALGRTGYALDRDNGALSTSEDNYVHGVSGWGPEVPQIEGLNSYRPTLRASGSSYSIFGSSTLNRSFVVYFRNGTYVEQFAPTGDGAALCRTGVSSSAKGQWFNNGATSPNSLWLDRVAEICVGELTGTPLADSAAPTETLFTVVYDSGAQPGGTDAFYDVYGARKYDVTITEDDGATPVYSGTDVVGTPDAWRSWYRFHYFDATKEAASYAAIYGYRTQVTSTVTPLTYGVNGAPNKFTMVGDFKQLLELNVNGNKTPFYSSISSVTGYSGNLSLHPVGSTLREIIETTEGNLIYGNYGAGTVHADKSAGYSGELRPIIALFDDLVESVDTDDLADVVLLEPWSMDDPIHGSSLPLLGADLVFMKDGDIVAVKRTEEPVSITEVEEYDFGIFGCTDRYVYASIGPGTLSRFRRDGKAQKSIDLEQSVFDTNGINVDKKYVWNTVRNSSTEEMTAVGMGDIDPNRGPYTTISFE